MTKRMLIDGTHAEEVRVVITSANRLDEYDVETSTKRQLKGNIYLAKITRVEPSLQAAFVDFGGDRHGFLAFNDIHPDYFQIPVADREALVAAENAEGDTETAAQALVDEIDSTVEEISDTEEPDADEPDTVEDEPDSAIAESAGTPAADIAAAESAEEEPEGEAEGGGDASAEETEDGPDAGGGEAGTENAETETAAADGESEAGEKKRPPPRRRRRGRKRNEGDGDAEAGSSSRRLRRYKIQEVIKRNQIILVQVVKEERGNKGAALTTLYLARRPLLRADAEHRAGRRNLAQDHQPERAPQAEENHRRPRDPERHGRDHAHRRDRAQQGGNQARLRLSEPHLGRRAGANLQFDRADPWSTRTRA